MDRVFTLDGFFSSIGRSPEASALAEKKVAAYADLVQHPVNLFNNYQALVFLLVSRRTAGHETEGVHGWA
jgi:hypothetical protein